MITSWFQLLTTHAPPKKASDKPSKREIIARRTALEFQDGMFANLGIGIPTLAQV